MNRSFHPDKMNILTKEDISFIFRYFTIARDIWEGHESEIIGMDLGRAFEGVRGRLSELIPVIFRFVRAFGRVRFEELTHRDSHEIYRRFMDFMEGTDARKRKQHHISTQWLLMSEAITSLGFTHKRTIDLLLAGSGMTISEKFIRTKGGWEMKDIEKGRSYKYDMYMRSRNIPELENVSKNNIDGVRILYSGINAAELFFTIVQNPALISRAGMKSVIAYLQEEEPGMKDLDLSTPAHIIRDIFPKCTLHIDGFTEWNKYFGKESRLSYNYFPPEVMKKIVAINRYEISGDDIKIGGLRRVIQPTEGEYRRYTSYIREISRRIKGLIPSVIIPWTGELENMFSNTLWLHCSTHIGLCQALFALAKTEDYQNAAYEIARDMSEHSESLLLQDKCSAFLTLSRAPSISAGVVNYAASSLFLESHMELRDYYMFYYYHLSLFFYDHVRCVDFIENNIKTIEEIMSDIVRHNYPTFYSIDSPTPWIKSAICKGELFSHEYSSSPDPNRWNFLGERVISHSVFQKYVELSERGGKYAMSRLIGDEDPDLFAITEYLYARIDRYTKGCINLRRVVVVANGELLPNDFDKIIQNPFLPPIKYTMRILKIKSPYTIGELDMTTLSPSVLLAGMLLSLLALPIDQVMKKVLSLILGSVPDDIHTRVVCKSYGAKFILLYFITAFHEVYRRGIKAKLLSDEILIAINEMPNLDHIDDRLVLDTVLSTGEVRLPDIFQASPDQIYQNMIGTLLGDSECEKNIISIILRGSTH